jgi:hypothetical protein
LASLRASHATFGPAAGHSGLMILPETTTACSYFHACHFAVNFPFRDVVATRNERTDGFFTRHQRGRSFDLVCAMGYKKKERKMAGTLQKPLISLEFSSLAHGKMENSLPG